MSLTAAQYQTLILAELGDTADGALAASLDLLWQRFDGVASLEARYHASKLAAIDFLLGQTRTEVDFRTSSGSAISASQAFAHLQALRAGVELALGALGAGSGGVALGPLTKTAPLTPTSGQVDPNRRALRGDPLKRL